MHLFIYLFGLLVSWLFNYWNKELKRTKSYVIILPNYTYVSLASKWFSVFQISVLVVDSEIHKYNFMADMTQKTHNKWELKAWLWWMSMYQRSFEENSDVSIDKWFFYGIS